MDTTLMEYTAEDLIAHKLQRSGILVAKPKFDRESTDLLGLLTVKDHAKFCRIQCKGRSLTGSSSSEVYVYREDVSNAFILFLFVETEDLDTTYLFTFFGSEIEHDWEPTEKNGRPVYLLRITASKLDHEWKPNRFDESKVGIIKALIEQADVTGEFKILFPGQGDLTTGAARSDGVGNVTEPPKANETRSSGIET